MDAGASPEPRRRGAASWTTSRRILVTALIVGLTGSAAGFGTSSAFSSSTQSSGNSFAAGTVTIEDNDLGGTMVTLSNAKPGDTTSGCIAVTYTGSLAANVRLYATVSGSLASYLTVTVTRGTNAGSFPSCSPFPTDSTNYGGSGVGVLYSGSLSSYPSGYATGIVDPADCGSPPCSAESWSSSETHYYKVSVTLNNDNNAQGLSATATFTWEARNT